MKSEFITFHQIRCWPVLGIFVALSPRFSSLFNITPGFTHMATPGLFNMQGDESGLKP